MSSRSGIRQTFIVLGAVTLLICIPGMILNSYFREIARRDSCQSNLKQIALAMELYSQDYGGYLPPPQRWIDVLVPKYLSHHVLTCPASTRTHGPDYAMNSALKGMKLKDIKNSSEVVMAFESQSGTNMHGGPELLLRRPRHRGGDNIAFAYDHVEWVKRSDAGKLKWKVGKKPLSAAK